MQIVIEIDDEKYEAFMNDWVFTMDMLYAVKKGTPLPKWHGRLGDLDKLEKEMNDYIKSIPLPYHEAERLVLLMNNFDNAPTIIEGSDSE